MTIAGADEVALDLSLIKGGGGALLREKIVAQASRRELSVVDEEKLWSMLGTRWVVPVQVIRHSQAEYLQGLGFSLIDMSRCPFTSTVPGEG